MQTDSNESKIEKYKNNKVVREYKITDEKNNNKVYKGKYFVASFFPAKDITPERFNGNKTNINNATCFATYNDQVLTAPFNYLNVGYILGDFNYKGCFMEDSFSDQLPNIEPDQRISERFFSAKKENPNIVFPETKFGYEKGKQTLKHINGEEKKQNERNAKNLVSIKPGHDGRDPIERMIKKSNRYTSKYPFNKIEKNTLISNSKYESGVEECFQKQQYGHYVFCNDIYVKEPSDSVRGLVHNDIVLDDNKDGVKIMSLVIREPVFDTSMPNKDIRIFKSNTAKNLIDVSLKNIKNYNVVILTGGTKRERKILETSIENAILRDFLIYNGIEPLEKYKDNLKKYKLIKNNYIDDFCKTLISLDNNGQMCKVPLSETTKTKLAKTEEKEDIINILKGEKQFCEFIQNYVKIQYNELKNRYNSYKNMPQYCPAFKTAAENLKSKIDNFSRDKCQEDKICEFADKFLEIRKEYLLPEELIKYVKKCREQNSTLYKIKGFFKNLFNFNYHDPCNKQASFHTDIVNGNINTPFSL